jgi:hypothetical protein
MRIKYEFGNASSIPMEFLMAHPPNHEALSVYITAKTPQPPAHWLEQRSLEDVHDAPCFAD